MPKNKRTYELTLEIDQMNFLRAATERYGLADEDKAMCIVMDYIVSNRDIHDDIFSHTRCLRCG